MKVVYKKSIIEKMDEAIRVAKYEYPAKEIEKFVITQEELEELDAFCSSRSTQSYYEMCKRYNIPMDYFGIRVEVED